MRSVIETIKEKLNASSFVKYSEEVRIVDFVIEREYPKVCVNLQTDVR